MSVNTIFKVEDKLFADIHIKLTGLQHMAPLGLQCVPFSAIVSLVHVLSFSLAPSFSPSQPDLSISVSGGAFFLLPIVHWLNAILIKLLTPLHLFQVTTRICLSSMQPSLASSAIISSICETIVAIAKLSRSTQHIIYVSPILLAVVCLSSMSV